MEEGTLPQERQEQEVPKTADTNPYIVDEKFRTIEVEYDTQKRKLEHGFVIPDPRELIQFYLKAPSLTAMKKGERNPLGQPSAPAAELHDQMCGQLRRLLLDGTVEKNYTLEDVRGMRRSVKADGALSYIGGYYDVELSVESGDLDDLLFDKETQLTATVKTRPFANGKVGQTFKIFLNRPDDLSFERFSQHASSTSIIDKNDPLLEEFLGAENLAEMTGGIDEGERVAFSKNTQHVRHLISIFDKNFMGGENIVLNGQPYNADKRNVFVQKLDPVLKINIAAALRNFM